MGLLRKRNKDISVLSPIKGEAVSLSEVSDPTFSEGILGKGIAIMPADGKVYAPVNGVIESVAETSHAIAILGDNGAEILIHIGIDTVELKGKPFIVSVEENDRISCGQLLLEFDLDEIKSAGYETITPIIITNSENFTSFEAIKGEVLVGDELIKLLK